MNSMNSMNCMRCGREIALGLAFCKDCLEDMAHYPVNPTTPIQIPVHPPLQHPVRRNSRPRKTRKPEEQILRLRKYIRMQSIIIVVLMSLLIALGIFTCRKLSVSVQPSRPGENYSTDKASRPDGM